MIKHRKIIICILLSYALFIVGIFNVRAESYWATYDLNYEGAWSNTIITSEERQFLRLNLNTGAGSSIGTYGITNGSRLSNKIVTFVFYSDDIPVTDIYLKSGNDNSYACEIYGHLSEGSLQMYNVICPYVGVVTDGYTNIRFVTNHSSLNGTYSFGISKINYFTSMEESANSTAQNTSDINNSLNDSSIDTNNTTSSTTSWGDKNASNGTITNLLTLPISLLQAIVNGIQSSCSSFNLGSLFGTNIVLPCINIGSLIGSALWSTIDILFSGFMILAIAKKLIKIFNDFTNLKTNQVDELYGGGK